MKKCYYCGRSDGGHQGACTPVAIEPALPDFNNETWTTSNDTHFSDAAAYSIEAMKATLDKFEQKFGLPNVAYSPTKWTTMHRFSDFAFRGDSLYKSFMLKCSDMARLRHSWLYGSWDGMAEKGEDHE